jgi:hypothetical protein
MHALYHLIHAPSPFFLIIFEMGFCFLPRPAWTEIILFYSSAIAGVTVTMPSFFLLRWSPHELFCSGWPRTVIPVVSGSHIAGMTGMSHHTQFIYAFLRRIPKEMILMKTFLKECFQMCHLRLFIRIMLN